MRDEQGAWKPGPGKEVSARERHLRDGEGGGDWEVDEITLAVHHARLIEEPLGEGLVPYTLMCLCYVRACRHGEFRPKR